MNGSGETITKLKSVGRWAGLLQDDIIYGAVNESEMQGLGAGHEPPERKKRERV